MAFSHQLQETLPRKISSQRRVSPCARSRRYDKNVKLGRSLAALRVGVELLAILIPLTTGRFKIEHQVFHVQSELAESVLDER